jgi:hypothetical protein
MNKISSLKRDDNSWCVDEKAIHEEVHGLYQLYTSQGAPNMHVFYILYATVSYR